MSTKDLILDGQAVLGIEFGSTRIKAVLIDETNIKDAIIKTSINDMDFFKLLICSHPFQVYNNRYLFSCIVFTKLCNIILILLRWLSLHL